MSRAARAVLAVLAALLASGVLATEPPPDRTCEDKAAFGYIDTVGKMVIAPQFVTASNFSEGLASVTLKDGSAVYIDKTGARAFPQTFTYAGSFQEGLACVTGKDGTSVVDKTGKAVIAGLSYCTEFSEGLARLTSPAGSGYFDKAGKLVIPVDAKLLGQYGDFHEGYASTYEEPLLGGIKCGYLDRKGKHATVTKHQGCIGVGDVREGKGRLFVRHGDSGMRQGFVLPGGRVVIAPGFDDVGEFRDGLAAVEKGGKWGFIDGKGSLVIPHQFDFENANDQRNDLLDDYPRFQEGLALVFRGRMGQAHAFFIDKSGKTKVELGEVVLARDFEDGLAFVMHATKSGFIDQTGKVRIDTTAYHRLHDFADGLAVVCRPPG